MKWFKHYHNADTSHKLCLLMETHGKIAYAEYWLLLELLCEKYKANDEKIRVTSGELCRKIRKPFPKKMETFLESLRNLSILDYKVFGKTFEFEAGILSELKQKDFRKPQIESDSIAFKSPLREKREERREKRKEKRVKKEYIVESKHRCFVDSWNSIARLPKIITLTEKRKRLIDQAISRGVDKEKFEVILNIVNQSDFLNGVNDRGWKASFDFIMKEETQVKILEGVYSSRTNSKAQVKQDTTLRMVNPYEQQN